MQGTPARVRRRASAAAAATRIRGTHEVQSRVEAGPDTGSMHGTDAGDLGVQCGGLALFGISVLADIDAAGRPSDEARLQRHANLARAETTSKQFVGGGDVAE